MIVSGDVDLLSSIGADLIDDSDDLGVLDVEALKAGGLLAASGGGDGVGVLDIGALKAGGLLADFDGDSAAAAGSGDRGQGSGGSSSQGGRLSSQGTEAKDDTLDRVSDTSASSMVLEPWTLLANDLSDIHSGALTITGVAMIDEAFGMVMRDKDGNVKFTLNKSLISLADGETQDVKFTYTITDGRDGSSTATVTITVVGTQYGDDFYEGDAGNNKVSGGDGDDVLKGFAGNDTLKGGNDDDFIDGGDGNDKLDGGNGDDTAITGAGDDHADGGKGDNTIDYSSATGWIKVEFSSSNMASVEEYSGQRSDGKRNGDGNSDDVLSTDAIRNFRTVFGSKYDDILKGHEGEDRLFGNEGDDYLRGDGLDAEGKRTESDDYLDGGRGSDFVWGEGGADIYVISPGHDEFYYFNVNDGDRLKLDGIDLFSGTGPTLSIKGTLGKDSILRFDSDKSGDLDASITFTSTDTFEDFSGDVSYRNLDDLEDALRSLFGYTGNQDIII